MKLFFYILPVLFFAISCSDNDETTPKEDNTAKYIARSKERIEPFLDTWILEKEIHPFEKFVLFILPIDNSFRSIRFSINHYSSIEHNSDVMTFFHNGVMQYVYKDRINLTRDHLILIDEKNINDESNEYEIYFQYKNFGNNSKFKMTLLDENTLELSYVDKNTQKTMSLNFVRKKV